MWIQISTKIEALIPSIDCFIESFTRKLLANQDGDITLTPGPRLLLISC